MDDTLPKKCFDEKQKRLTVPLKFNLKSVLKGRSDPNSYSFFFDIFVPLLEKKSTFNEKLMTATKDEELLCISSEAFGLLVLENHLDRWLDIYTKCGGKIKDKKNKEKLTNIQPKYTRGGLRNGQNKDIGIGKGWSFEGIDCFNELFAFVRQDRKIILILQEIG